MDENSDHGAMTLKYLRMLVTALTTVMIVGFIVLIAFLVTRFPDAPGLALPEQISLPDGLRAVAFTQATDWYAVVTDSNQILIFERKGGALVQTIEITPPNP